MSRPLRLGRFLGELAREQLERFFWLNDADLARIGLVNWQANSLAVAEGLHRALRRRDVFVIGAGRWGDPRAKLLDDEEWAAEQPTVVAALQLPAEPQGHLASVARELDDAYRGGGSSFPRQRAGDDRRRPRARR